MASPTAPRARHEHDAQFQTESDRLIAPGHDFGSVTDTISKIVLQRETPKGWWIGFAIGFGLLQLMLYAIVNLLFVGIGVWGVTIPIGWGFERFNPLGAYRESDAHGPIDARGVLQSLQDGSKQEFDGAVELAHILVQSERAHECVARQWLRFALARADVPADSRSIADAVRVFREEGKNIGELMIAIAGTPSFTTRSPASGEVLR